MELTGPQKAAVVVTQMPPRVAAAVIKEMAEVDVSLLSRTIAELPELSEDLVRPVVAECLDRVRAMVAVNQGGIGAARRILAERFGSARADEELEVILAGTRPTHPLDFLHAMEPAQLSAFLADEHPQTTAMVVASLTADFASSVISNLDDDRRSDIAYRIGTMGKVPPEALDVVAKAMDAQLRGAAMPTGGAGGGTATLAAILNRSDRALEREVLGQMEQTDPELAEDVRRRLFTFEDVIRLDDRTLQKVLRAVQPKVLATALKGATEENREVFTHNLSERAADDLTEEIELLGPMRLAEVEGAQMELVRTVRDLEAAGEIVIIREGDDVVA
ncbi:MAG: flagellar motor switch protein FliG [Acidimicrobiales bacterium]